MANYFRATICHLFPRKANGPPRMRKYPLLSHFKLVAYTSSRLSGNMLYFFQNITVANETCWIAGLKKVFQQLNYQPYFLDCYCKHCLTFSVTSGPFYMRGSGSSSNLTDRNESTATSDVSSLCSCQMYLHCTILVLPTWVNGPNHLLNWNVLIGCFCPMPKNGLTLSHV